MRILLIGCGGIGSWLCHFLAFGRRNSLLPINTSITVADPDVVEARNLLYSNFEAQDVGMNKAAVLASRYSYICSPKEMKSSKELEPYDIVLVATDNARSRKMVYESGKHWIDMRCKGDLWAVFTSDNRKAAKDFKPKGKDLNISGQSCQFEADLASRNVKFGCLMAAGAGYQKLLSLVVM